MYDYTYRLHTVIGDVTPSERAVIRLQHYRYAYGNVGCGVIKRLQLCVQAMVVFQQASSGKLVS